MIFNRQHDFAVAPGDGVVVHKTVAHIPYERECDGVEGHNKGLSGVGLLDAAGVGVIVEVESYGAIRDVEGPRDRARISQFHFETVANEKAC